MNLFYEAYRNDAGIMVNKNLINAIGKNATLLFGELLSKKYYYEEKGLIDNGWFYEVSKMIELNTGLSYYEQKKAENILIKEGLLKTDVRGIPAKKYYFIIENEDNLRRVLNQGKLNKEKILREINALKPSFQNFKNYDLNIEEIDRQNSNVINNRELIKEELNNTYIVENEKNEKQEAIPYEEIVNYLNEKTGKQYRHTTPKTRELIKARWNEGFTLDDFKKVIDNKTLEWKNTKWENYLRPVTLFSTKFESYLNDDPNIILRKKKEESKKEEYNIQEFFERLEIDYIIELTGNEYMAKKRFNEFAEKFGVDKDQRTLFNEFSAWCRKLRDGERV